MAFSQEPTKIPTSIGTIVIELHDTNEVYYNIKIGMSDGSVVIKTGNLVPHLTAQQISQIELFMTTLRTKAEDEFL